MRGDELTLLQANPWWALYLVILIAFLVWLVVLMAKDGLFSDWAELFHEEPERVNTNVVQFEARNRNELDR